MERMERLRAVAELARLDAPETDALAAELDAVRAFAEALPALPPDAPHGDYRAVAAAGLSDLRADEPAASLPGDAAERLAPAWRDGCVAVPRTVE